MMLSPFFLSSGSTVFAEIQGVIDACIKLSGMPDLSLSFMVSFILLSVFPCVANTHEVLNEIILRHVCILDCKRLSQKYS